MEGKGKAAGRTSALFRVFAAAAAAAVFLCGCSFRDILKYFGYGENAPSPDELSEEIESVDLNKDKGILYVNSDLVLIAEKDAASETIRKLAEEYEAELDRTLEEIGVYRFAFRDPKTYEELEKTALKLKDHPAVDNAHLNIVVSFSGDGPVYPEDSWEEGPWEMDSPSGKNWGMEAVRAPEAWSFREEMKPVRVGIIDSMPDTSHPDLTFADCSSLFVDTAGGSVSVNKYPMEARDHGTHVSGIMGAGWNNSSGTAGILADCGELCYSAVYYDDRGKIVDSYATAFSYVLALKRLIDEDVRVINISQNTGRLTGFAASHGNGKAVRSLQEQAELTEECLLRIIDAREAEGAPDFVICVAAGNSNDTVYYRDENETYGFREDQDLLEKLLPGSGNREVKGGSLARYNNFLNMMEAGPVKDRIIVVGSVGLEEEPGTGEGPAFRCSAFSNVGDRVDIMAPGENIWSCTVGGSGSMSGTSMAAPHVSGTAGLMFAVNPDLTGPEVKRLLLGSAEGRFYYEGGCSGLLNAGAAVADAAAARDRNVDQVLASASENALDLCFVIDTTGSMNDDIDDARRNMKQILGTLSSKTSDYRVALVDYRDFRESSRDIRDYPSRVQLEFTSDDNRVLEAISSLELGHGGDDPETVYSGLMEAARLPWRTEAKKVIIVLGDAPPHDPELYTGYTYADVLRELENKDIEVDHVASGHSALSEWDGKNISVYAIGTSASVEAVDFFHTIADDTDGHYSEVYEAADVGRAIIESIEEIHIEENVSAGADFGEKLAGKRISLFREDQWWSSFVTDERGSCFLEDVPPGSYTWRCSDPEAYGTAEFTAGEDRALIITEESGEPEDDWLWTEIFRRVLSLLRKVLKKTVF